MYQVYLCCTFRAKAIVNIRYMPHFNRQLTPCSTNALVTGWLERQKGMISNHMIVLMQAEVERFHAGTMLLHDYHHIKTQEVGHEDSIMLVSSSPPLVFCSGSAALEVDSVVFIIMSRFFVSIESIVHPSSLSASLCFALRCIVLLCYTLLCPTLL